MFGLSMGSNLLNEYNLENAPIQQELVIVNDSDKPCFVRIYSEDMTNIANSWFYTLPDTILIEAASNYSYYLKTNIPDNLPAQSYNGRIYVEETGVDRSQKTRFGSIGTSIRYEINNIYHKNYNPQLNVDLQDLKISDNKISFDLLNEDDYFLNAEILIQTINHSGEINAEIKEKYNILNKNSRKCSINMNSDFDSTTIKHLIIVITNQENEMCVFEKEF